MCVTLTESIESRFELQLVVFFQRATILDAGAISGICLAVIGLSLVISAVGVMLYRRRYINKPQTLSEPDSSGYIDDSTIRVRIVKEGNEFRKILTTFDRFL